MFSLFYYFAIFSTYVNTDEIQRTKSSSHMFSNGGPTFANFYVYFKLILIRNFAFHQNFIICEEKFATSYVQQSLLHQRRPEVFSLFLKLSSSPPRSPWEGKKAWLGNGDEQKPCTSLSHLGSHGSPLENCR